MADSLTELEQANTKLDAANDAASATAKASLATANTRIATKKALTLTQTRDLAAALSKVVAGMTEVSTQSGIIKAKAAALRVAPAPAPTPVPAPSPVPPSETGWRPLKIGAGGFITGHSMSKDGVTRVIHNDTYGDHRWVNDRWEQMLTFQSMGAEAGPGKGSYVYETVVAPSDNKRIYRWMKGKVWRSDDAGASWKATAYAAVPDKFHEGGAAFAARTSGPNMAVDPNDPNIVISGGFDAPTRITRDGGGSWANLSLPAPNVSGIRVAYLSSSVVVVAVSGNGVHASTDGAKTFKAIGGPVAIRRMALASDGIIYATADDGTAHRYDGTWTKLVVGWGQFDAVAADPRNPARIVLCGGGFLDVSNDRGNSWVKTPGEMWGPTCVAPNTPFASQRRSAAGDVTWLEWTQECIISVASIDFDPVVPNRLWLASGVGVWFYDFESGTAQPAKQITWKSQSRGIEQLCSNEILSPPGGKTNYFGWDRPQFVIDDPEKYPATHGPNALHAINMGWGADFCASQPSLLAAVMNWWGDGKEQSGTSNDGGRTWTKFAAIPPDMAIGGNIAVCSPNMMLWSPQNNQHPAITRDGGKSWQKLMLPGIPATGESGYGFAYYLNTCYAAADRVAPNTAYQFNYLPSGGIFRIDDRGIVRIKVGGVVTPGASPANAKMKTVLGHAGHLFFAHGPQGDGGQNFGGFFRATNAHAAGEGQLNLTAVPRVGGVVAFGFGKSFADYPAVYIAGWVDDVYGVWRGEGTKAEWDAGSTKWTNLTADCGGCPTGSFDGIDVVSGDMNIVGRAYVGFTGSGAAYYQAAA